MENMWSHPDWNPRTRTCLFEETNLKILTAIKEILKDVFFFGPNWRNGIYKESSEGQEIGGPYPDP